MIPVGPGREQRHGEIVEAPVGGRVGHVGGEVEAAGVDLGVGRDVGNGGEVEVHHARVVRHVRVGTVEAGLEDEREEKRPRKRIKIIFISKAHYLRCTGSFVRSLKTPII